VLELDHVLNDETERSWQARVERWAGVGGWHAMHNRVSVGSRAGFPDLVLLGVGRVVAAELKTNAGKLSAEQADWLDWFSAAGALACVWRPRDWRAIQNFLLLVGGRNAAISGGPAGPFLVPGAWGGDRRGVYARRYVRRDRRRGARLPRTGWAAQRDRLV
jgi:hypothetical protein